MAHQAHAIPWGGLVSNFQYLKNQHGTRDIWALDKANQVKSLTHFAKAFAKNLREYAETERRKYAPADEYRRRAETWTISDRGPDVETQNAPRQQLGNNPVETRKVFSDHDRDVWSTRRILYRQDGLIDETQYIENWIAGDAHWICSETNRQDYRLRDKWVGNWTDNVKAMMMEAALVTTPLHERQAKRDEPSPKHLKYMDTLFLLAHHPAIPLLSWTHEGDSCCNIESGLICVIEAALTGYIYLNMLSALREVGSNVCQLTEEVCYRESWRHYYSIAKSKLCPRPIYMNTPSWYGFLKKTCSEHSHHPEVMMFEPFLHPQVGENFTLASSQTPPVQGVLPRRDGSALQEVDVMNLASGTDDQMLINSPATRGSPAALREFLRGLWKIMINYEMLWSDQGAPPNWEVMVADRLETCFRGITDTRQSLFWDDRQQSVIYRLNDLFNGNVERSENQTGAVPAKDKSQKEKNKHTRREARRLARSNDKLNS